MTAFRQRLVYLLVIFNILPHFGDLASWIPMVALTFVSWRWISDLLKIKVPCRWLTGTFAVICTASVWAEFHRVIDDQASVALLILMVSIKTFEIRGYRDVMFVTYLCLLLLMGKLLNSQTLASTIFMLVDVVAILALMNLYHSPTGATMRSPLRGVLRLLGQSAPILVLLFVVFPRYQLHLFSRPQERLGQVGFSPQVNPGSVSQLVNSDAIAFRAFFSTDGVPTYSQLYWRGAVLNHSRGLDWDREGEPRGIRHKSLVSGDRVEVILEPSTSRWIFTLDWPQAIGLDGLPLGAGFMIHPGRTYESQTAFSGTERYYFNYSSTPAEIQWEDDPNDYLKVDATVPETSKLVGQWRKKSASTVQFLSHIREFYQREKFFYSLAPAAVKNVDEFLITTKQGYCEHYAAATATMLRLAGIPARVVVGYQGGALSLMGDYMIVRQQDAHAWVEYWSKESGSWLRTDPTQWVAPERIQLGARRYMERSEPGRYGVVQFPLLGKLLGSQIMQWLGQGQLLADQAEVYWVSFLLRYDYDYQKDLFAKLGWAKVSRGLLALLTMAVLGVSALFAVFLIRLRQRRRVDPMVSIYRELCRRLASKGLARLPGEGPLNLCSRACARFPQAATQLQEIFNAYIEVRYGGGKLGEREYWRIRARVRHLSLSESKERAA